jgi:hypothetical protein
MFIPESLPAFGSFRPFRKGCPDRPGTKNEMTMDETMSFSTSTLTSTCRLGVTTVVLDAYPLSGVEI